MADLRALLQHLGFRDVRTLANSGNVAFKATGRRGGHHAARIAKALADELGVAAPVFVLGVPALAAALADNPLRAVATDPARLLLAVTATRADRAALAELAELDWAPEALVLGKAAAYLWCARGISVGRLFDAVNRRLGDGVTTRNWATMAKLLELARSPAA